MLIISNINWDMNNLQLGQNVMTSNLYNPSFNTMSPQKSLNDVVNQIVNFHIMQNFTTGNPLIDTMIQICAISLVAFIGTQLNSICSYIVSKIKYWTILFFDKIKESYVKWRNVDPKITKYAHIPKIDEQRKINDLYDIVYDYLTNLNNVDYSKEKFLNYSCVKSNQIKNDKLHLNITPINNAPSHFKFNDYKIYFSFDKQIETLYLEREKKKENHIIKLWVEVDETSKIDVFRDFIEMCKIEYDNKKKSKPWKQMIYTNKNAEWVGEESNNQRRLETVILQNGLKEEIVKDINGFLNRKEFCLERDIPYRLGLLFMGHPGTGKTSLIKAISLKYQRHIHFVMLQNIKDDNELFDLMKKINYEETIIVFEDIDATINAVKTRFDNKDEKEDDEKEKDKDNKEEGGGRNRKNHNQTFKSQVTLAGLLNVLDGLTNCNGRILIMTSNKPEVLDPALLRAGRCDIKYQFNNCSRSQIKDIFEMFFQKELNKSYLSKIKAYEYSPAHITSVFMRYIHDPYKAIEHIDDTEERVYIKEMIDDGKDEYDEVEKHDNTEVNEEEQQDDVMEEDQDEEHDEDYEDSGDSEYNEEDDEVKSDEEDNNLELETKEIETTKKVDININSIELTSNKLLSKI